MIECDLCTKKSGQYLLDRICCALRLIHSAPQGPVRKAMALHVRRSVGAEQWDSIVAASASIGLLHND